MTATASASGLSTRGARGRWVLAARVGGSVIAQIDANAVGIALPAIGRDFHTDLAPLQWVFIAYAPGERAKAIGVWSGLGGVAGAVGPFLGGWLVQAAYWRFIFVINLPIAVAVALIARRHVPESRDPAATGRVDLAGGVLVTLGLVGLTYGLVRGGDGWLTIVAGAILLAVFVAWERRTRMPILPLHLFSSRRFSATNVVTFAVYAALGALFLLPIHLQQVSGYSPLEAGLARGPARWCRGDGPQFAA